MRLQLPKPETMDPAQREVYDEAANSKNKVIPPPMMAWLASAEMSKHATRLGRVLRYDTMFPMRLTEIAILVTARYMNAHYEWYAHKKAALNNGIGAQIVDDICHRRTPVFDDPKQRVIYDVAKSLHESKGLSQVLYDEAVATLTERGLVEIVALCGYYTMVAMTLNTFEFPLPDGQASDLV